MNEEINPNEYKFSTSDEIYINDVVGQVLSDIDCDPDCISEELQMLRNIYNQSMRLSFFDIVASSIRKISILTSHSSDAKNYDYISSSPSGIKVREQGTSRYSLIRGTAYSLPIERYSLLEVKHALDQKFSLESNIKLTIEDFSSRVPMISARSTIGQFGYLVTSNIIDSNEEGRSRISNRIDISRAPIQDISTEL